MSRRQRHKAHVNHERWLVSYADFITLLFAVFVVLYAASQVDHKKIGKMAHAIQAGFSEMGVFQGEGPQAIDTQAASSVSAAQKAPQSDKGTGDLDTNELRKVLGTALASEIAKNQVKLWDGPDGLVLSLREVGFYDQGSDVLKETSREILDKMAAVLKPGNYRIRIEGHTDDVPIHNTRFASNWELSAARATGMVRIFLERYSFDPSRLAAAGYAEFHPVESNDTPEGRAGNRRVDVVVIGASKNSGSKASKTPVDDKPSPSQTPASASSAPLITSDSQSPQH